MPKICDNQFKFGQFWNKV